MKNNYDRIANAYDFLSWLVFQKSQVNAQINQLKYLKANSRILIAGGGTGWILEEIGKCYTKGLKITYLEISEKMIRLSRLRNCAENEVVFLAENVLDFKSEAIYDFVLTPFLFDNFKEETALNAFRILHQSLNEGGIWMFTDFDLGNSKGMWWKKAFLKLMYAFFNRISNVEANQLIDMKKHFQALGYRKLEEREYYRSFIKATVYQKEI